MKSGTQVNFSILPEAGYEVQQVLLNDADITSDVKNNTYTCTATENLAFEVVFVASVPERIIRFRLFMMRRWERLESIMKRYLPVP